MTARPETDSAAAHPASAPAQHWCLRRTNPFLGLAAVVRTEGGHALSLDGRHWQLEVAAYPPRGLWSADGHSEQLRFFRFGTWSEAEGVSQVPLNPIMDIGRMLNESERLIGAIRNAAPRLPFPLAAELELWLLDSDDAPLALLATAIDLDGKDQLDLDQFARPHWNAGGRGERRFRSAALSARGIPERDGASLSLHADLLERRVEQAAGRRRQAQWFRRDAEGGSCVGHHAPAHLLGRRLPARAFPALTLRTEWQDAEDAALVADYIRWLSPYLLMLPGLDEALRARLERSAAKHALAVAKLWRLYPRLIDSAFVRRARVEAELRLAAESKVPA